MPSANINNTNIQNDGAPRVIGAVTVTPSQTQSIGTVVLNRTGGGNFPWLNTLTAATELDVAIDSSTDGGTNWRNEASLSAVGGIFTDRHGATVTTVQLGVGPIDPAANRVRLVCTVPTSSPSPVEISGTVSVTP